MIRESAGLFKVQELVEKGLGMLSTATNREKEVTFSRGYQTLIKSIGECKSKTEEDRIMARERSELKQVRSLFHVDGSCCCQGHTIFLNIGYYS